MPSIPRSHNTVTTVLFTISLFPVVCHCVVTAFHFILDISLAGIRDAVNTHL